MKTNTRIQEHRTHQKRRAAERHRAAQLQAVYQNRENIGRRVLTGPAPIPVVMTYWGGFYGSR